MTDNEIIKALECCRQPVGSGSCNSCPFDYQRKKRLEKTDKSCTELMFDCVLDLINRQKAEIERLCMELDEVIIAKDLLFDEAEALIKKTKVEAFKEFAARLRYVSKWSQSDAFSDRLVTVRDINDLEEEMVGEG